MFIRNILKFIISFKTSFQECFSFAPILLAKRKDLGINKQKKNLKSLDRCYSNQTVISQLHIPKQHITKTPGGSPISFPPLLSSSWHLPESKRNEKRETAKKHTENRRLTDRSAGTNVRKSSVYSQGRWFSPGLSTRGPPRSSRWHEPVTAFFFSF